jgi:heparan-alpha-glucosaminide N-acetyltransferase
MTLPSRIQSIDVLRAITMFLMIFVNDVAGVARIPEWIGHTAADVDGMGFSDIIFPAFLFIVGLSLPFAIQARIKKGDSFIAIAMYILLRSLALIVMGFFHVNLESYNSELAGLSRPIYTLLLTTGFFLVWLAYPKELPNVKKYSLTVLGVILLLGMAYFYKGGSAEDPKGLAPHWWGILGLIGWAYLFSAFTYLLTRGKILWLIIAFAIYALINITTHLGLLHLDLWQIGDASSITLMIGGTVIATSYQLLIAKQEDKKLWLLLAMAGLLCIIFGFVIRPFAAGISKIYATPAWVFICMGISILSFQLMIYLVDVKGKRDWFKWIKPAGTSTLTCYLMPYVIYALLSLVHFSYPAFFNEGAGGILRSFLVAFIVIRIVAVMEKYSIRLKV